MAETSAAAGWLSRLVRIPSVNPAQAGPGAGVPGEAALASALEGWFRELGGEVESDEVLPGRRNVYGIWRGETGRWAGVDAHMDTVGVEQMEGDPFSGAEAEGRVHGRGATDTKATLAVALALIEELHRCGRRPQCGVVAAATIDEEVGAAGAPAFAAWLQRRGLILDELAVAEPTGCRPVVEHKGVLRLEFRVQGRAAHSSQPDAGRNAVTAAARLALAFEEESIRLQRGPAHPELGTGLLTVTGMRGGRGMNVVPDECVVEVDRRTVPGEPPAETTASLQALAESACPLPFTTRLLKQIDAFAQPRHTPWVRRMAAWCGQEPVAVPYCTNAWAYPAVARERLVLGPGSIDQAHGAREWIEVTELERLAAIYRRWWLEG